MNQKAEGRTEARKRSVAILVLSDRASAGIYHDRTGPEIAAVLSRWGWTVELLEILPDDEHEIASRLADYAERGIELILTAGGTGLSARDVTPEATLRVGDRLVPGISEAIRARTASRSPRSYLSRGVAVIRGSSLIVNLPGSVRGAVESLDAVADLLPHALDVLSNAGVDHVDPIAVGESTPAPRDSSGSPGQASYDAQDTEATEGGSESRPINRQDPPADT